MKTIGKGREAVSLVERSNVLLMSLSWRVYYQSLYCTILYTATITACRFGLAKSQALSDSSKAEQVLIKCTGKDLIMCILTKSLKISSHSL